MRYPIFLRRDQCLTYVRKRRSRKHTNFTSEWFKNCICLSPSAAEIRSTDVKHTRLQNPISSKFQPTHELLQDSLGVFLEQDLAAGGLLVLLDLPQVPLLLLLLVPHVLLLLRGRETVPHLAQEWRHSGPSDKLRVTGLHSGNVFVDKHDVTGKEWECIGLGQCQIKALSLTYIFRIVGHDSVADPEGGATGVHPL